MFDAEDDQWHNQGAENKQETEDTTISCWIKVGVWINRFSLIVSFEPYTDNKQALSIRSGRDLPMPTGWKEPQSRWRVIWTILLRLNLSISVNWVLVSGYRTTECRTSGSLSSRQSISGGRSTGWRMSHWDYPVCTSLPWSACCQIVIVVFSKSRYLLA